jgi:hypothetical protein
LKLLHKLCFERAGLQSRRKRRKINWALAPEGIYARKTDFLAACSLMPKKGRKGTASEPVLSEVEWMPTARSF